MRVVMIGLDCATQQLLFGRHAADMPTLTGLRQQGLWGPLESTVPPITVPAWSCMLSGRVAPTLQRRLGLPAPGGQQGRVLL